MNSLEYENYMETKAHADPLFPYNTYLCSIPLDFNAVPLHWHPYMEIVYIKKGKGNVTLDFTTHYVEEGDIIAIDIDANTLNVKVSDEELAKRKENWKPRTPKVTTGYLARYASLVTSGNRGAVLEIKQ